MNLQLDPFQGFGGADKFETRLLIPSKMGGAVIGKKGCNIQQLRSDYNATIRCAHFVLTELKSLTQNLAGSQMLQGQNESCLSPARTSR